jgi:hypothetical protein
MRDHVSQEIRRAFAATPRPADAFLVGSHDGCEPEESVAPFRGREWQSLDAAMLDANYTSLSFFSEGAFRYFLPAYLIADLDDALRTADPSFHLTNGLVGFETVAEAGGRSWRRRHGGDALLNPRRYGAMTWRDHARYRLSVFSREEATAIVSYLRWRAGRDEAERLTIDTALKDFWLDRAAHAAISAELEAHVREEQAFVEACMRDRASDGS